MSEPLTEPTAEPEGEQENVPEPTEANGPQLATGDEGRCEAETTVGGDLYRCALQEGHEDEHRWQVVEANEPAEQTGAKEHLKRLKALENEAERHARRIREIVGGDADSLVQCELCAPNFAGWRFDTAPSEEVTQRVRVAIGLPDVSNFAPSATERVCDDCRGLGKVRTGSVVPGQETARCDACGGKGYVSSRPRLNTTAPDVPAEAPVNGAPEQIDDGVKRDMFGTPEGDPDYNLMPAARQRPIEYWQQHRA